MTKQEQLELATYTKRIFEVSKVCVWRGCCLSFPVSYVLVYFAEQYRSFVTLGYLFAAVIWSRSFRFNVCISSHKLCISEVFITCPKAKVFEKQYFIGRVIESLIDAVA